MALHDPVLPPPLPRHGRSCPCGFAGVSAPGGPGFTAGTKTRSLRGGSEVPCAHPDADADGRCESYDNCPLVANPSQLDSDNDGAGDPCDAAPQDPGAFAVPGEVEEFSLEDDKVTLRWASAAPSSGALTVHDIARGGLDALPVGTATCLTGAGLSGETTADAELPAPGQGFWYLVRARNSLGTGTYGYQSNGTERITNACLP